MLKIILTIIQILIAIYWAGAAARQNVKINEILSAVEDGYAQFNSRIKDASIRSGLLKICTFYGWLAITMFAFLLLGRYFKSLSFAHHNAVLAFTYSFFAWGSLKWYLDHKSILKSFAPLFALFVGSPILFGIIDFIFATNLVFTLFASLYQMPLPFEMAFPQPSNLVLQGIVVSILILLFFAASYCITWILGGPIVFLSVTILASPIIFAKIVNKLAPKLNFFGFTVFVYIIVTLWLANL